MGVQAHRRPHPEIAGHGRSRAVGARRHPGAHAPHQLHGLSRGGGVGADTHHAADPGGRRLGQHREQLVALGPVVVLDDGSASRSSGAVGADAGRPPRSFASAREQRWRLLHRQAAGVPTPGRVLGQAAIVGTARRARAGARSPRWSRAWPATPEAPRSAAPRARSRGPQTTAGPGSAFHGSVASSSALVSRMRRHVASSATCGCPSPHAAVASSTTAALTALSRLSGSGAGPDAVALRPDHGRHTGHEVPEVVGQIGVVASRDALIGEVAVGPERRVAQEEVAHGVDTEVVGEVAAARSGWPWTSTSSRPTRAATRARAGGRADRCPPPCTWPATTRSGT